MSVLSGLGRKTLWGGCMANSSKMQWYKIVLAMFAMIYASTLWALGQTQMLSVNNDGVQADIDSSNDGPISISADGRFVVFSSYASNLAGDDWNKTADIFFYDLWRRKITLTSRSKAGVVGNGLSDGAAISADSRFIVFYSYANNLVDGDTNGKADIFLQNRITGDIEIISRSPEGGLGNNDSYNPIISSDGRYVVYASWASNLVSGDTNLRTDIFRYDRLRRETIRVSVGNNGQQSNGDSANNDSSPAMSADGRYVAFSSSADNLVAGDTNESWDVFLRDILAGKTERVSVNDSGLQGNDNSGYWSTPSVSADGRIVAFRSVATNLVDNDWNGLGDIFIRNLRRRETTRVSVDKWGNEIYDDDALRNPVLSANARYVFFESWSDSLVEGDSNGWQDIVVYDRGTGVSQLVSLNTQGRQGNNRSANPAVSADGRFIAFHSQATNFAPDVNGAWDVFVRDRWFIKGVTSMGVETEGWVSATPQSTSLTGLSDEVSAATTFRYVNFESTIRNNGTQVAKFVKLVHVLPYQGGITSVRVTEGRGNCSPARVSVCNIQNLSPGQTAKVHVEIKTALRRANMVSRAYIDASSRDNRHFDDRSTSVIRLR